MRSVELIGMVQSLKSTVSFSRHY